MLVAENYTLDRSQKRKYCIDVDGADADPIQTKRISYDRQTSIQSSLPLKQNTFPSPILPSLSSLQLPTFSHRNNDNYQINHNSVESTKNSCNSNNNNNR